MKIVQNLVAADKFNVKCPNPMAYEFIVVHNTANDASAQNEVSYMISNNSQVSFHYAVDDTEVVQGILDSRNAWHAGDGLMGKGNRKGLSVEICYSKSGGPRFDAAEKLAAKFIALKLKERGWGVDRVRTHQAFSGKVCPHRTLLLGWDRFLNMVQVELDALNKPSMPLWEMDLRNYANNADDWLNESAQATNIFKYLPELLAKARAYYKK